jgi:hypothetical protein
MSVRKRYIIEKCNPIPSQTDKKKECLNKAVGVSFPQLGLSRTSMASVEELQHELERDSLRDKDDKK